MKNLIIGLLIVVVGSVLIFLGIGGSMKGDLPPIISAFFLVLGSAAIGGGMTFVMRE